MKNRAQSHVCFLSFFCIVYINTSCHIRVSLTAGNSYLEAYTIPHYKKKIEYLYSKCFECVLLFIMHKM